ncbi:MAG: hypothetical protein WCI94_01375 [Rhodospirillales bacterium]
MPARRDWVTDEQQREDATRQTEALAGVAIVLVVLIAGLFLVHTLYDKSKIEDCLMAGRMDCDKLARGH